MAALCPKALVVLAGGIPAPLEVNLFYRTEERVGKIVGHLKQHGATKVFGTEPDAEIPDLEHARGLCTKEGIYTADVVLVPLEDGDRAQALRNMGKTTIVIDLNPMSRSSKTASVTIVDEVTRAIPNITKFIRELKDQPAIDFDNQKNLHAIVKRIREGI